MSFLYAMHDYYAGQKVVAIFGALVALAYIVLGKAAFTRPRHPARAFGITTLVIAGGLMLPANVAYFFYVGPQWVRIDSILARSQSDFYASENAHLNKMMNGFHRSYRLDSAVALLGFLIVAWGLAKKSRKAIGIGLAIALCATTLLGGEVWSKQRALHYQAALLPARGAG
jgi:hypothetical protein